MVSAADTGVSAASLDELRRLFAVPGNAGQRNVLDLDVVGDVVDQLRPLASHLLGETNLDDVRCRRGILFDKTPDRNWKVAWHQDRSIAVNGRAEAAGFGPWSRKAGVVHVQPPTRVLRQIVTLRLHLDDTPGSN
ncbi:MAG: phytanoyl-CoA dioxygenase, partial [Planctomycetota bacterium]